VLLPKNNIGLEALFSMSKAAGATTVSAVDDDELAVAVTVVPADDASAVGAGTTDEAACCELSGGTASGTPVEGVLDNDGSDEEELAAVATAAALEASPDACGR